MTDGAPITGEQPVVNIVHPPGGNGGGVWKWIAGVLAVAGIGGIITLHVSLARVEEQVIASKEYAEKQWSLQHGLNGTLREDTDNNTHKIISLEEAKHTHRRR
jgi:hypothetical protein